MNVVEDDSVAEVRKLLRSLQKSFQCTICLDLLSQPVSTKCNHQFCSECLNALLVKSNKKRPVSCPLCKTKVTKRSINSNPQLAGIVTAVRDVCNAADEDCEKIGTTPILSQRHKKSVCDKNVSKKIKTSLSFVSSDNDKAKDSDQPESVFDFASHEVPGSTKDFSERLTRSAEVTQQVSTHNGTKCEENGLLDRVKKCQKGWPRCKSLEVNPEHTSVKRKSKELTNNSVTTSVNDTRVPKKRKVLFNKQAKNFLDPQENKQDESPEIQFQNSEKDFKKKKKRERTKKKGVFNDVSNLINPMNEIELASYTCSNERKKEAFETASPTETKKDFDSSAVNLKAVDSADQTVPQSMSTDGTVTPLLPDSIFCLGNNPSAEESQSILDNVNDVERNEVIEITKHILSDKSDVVVVDKNVVGKNAKSKPSNENDVNRKSTKIFPGHLLLGRNNVYNMEIGDDVISGDKSKEFKVNAQLKCKESVSISQDTNSASMQGTHEQMFFVNQELSHQHTSEDDDENRKTVNEVSTPTRNKSCQIQLPQISLNSDLYGTPVNNSHYKASSLLKKSQCDSLPLWKISLANYVYDTVDFESIINKIESPNKDFSLFGNLSFSKVPLPVRGFMKPMQIVSAEQVSATEAVVSIKYKLTNHEEIAKKTLQKEATLVKNYKKSSLDKGTQKDLVLQKTTLDNNSQNVLTDTTQENSNNSLSGHTEKKCKTKRRSKLRDFNAIDRNIFPTANLEKTALHNTISICNDNAVLKICAQENAKLDKRDVLDRELTEKKAENIVFMEQEHSCQAKSYSEELIPPTPPFPKTQVSIRRSKESNSHCQTSVMEHYQDYATSRQGDILKTKHEIDVVDILSTGKSDQLFCEELEKMEVNNFKQIQVLQNENKDLLQNEEEVVHSMLDEDTITTDLEENAVIPTKEKEDAESKEDADISDEVMQDLEDDNIEVYTNEKHEGLPDSLKQKAMKIFSEGIIDNSNSEMGGSHVVKGDENDDDDGADSGDETDNGQKGSMPQICDDQGNLDLGKKFRQNIKELKQLESNKEEIFSQTSVDFDVSEPDLMEIKPSNSNIIESSGKPTKPPSADDLNDFFGDEIIPEVYEGSKQTSQQTAHVKNSQESKDVYKKTRVDNILSTCSDTSNNRTVKHAIENSFHEEFSIRKKHEKRPKLRVISDDEDDTDKDEVVLSKFKKPKYNISDGEDMELPLLNRLPSVTLHDSEKGVNLSSGVNKIDQSRHNRDKAGSAKLRTRERQRLERDRLAKQLQNYIDEMKKDDAVSDSSDDEILKKAVFGVEDIIKEKQRPSLIEIYSPLPELQLPPTHVEELKKKENLPSEHKRLSDENIDTLKHHLLSPISDDGLEMKTTKQNCNNDWTSTSHNRDHGKSAINSSAGSSRTCERELSPTTPSKLHPVPILQSTTNRNISDYDFKKPDGLGYKSNGPNRVLNPSQTAINSRKKSKVSEKVNHESIISTPKRTPVDSNGSLEVHPGKTDTPADETMLSPAHKRINVKQQSPHTTTEDTMDDQSHQVVVMMSRLTRKQTNGCEKICQRMGVKVVKTYSEKVTHLIVATDESNALSKMSYTYKYLLALVSGLWIVNFKWICDSYQQNRFVKEDEYEVSGDPTANQQNIPKLCRKSHQQKGSSMFDGYRLFLLGEFQENQIAKDQLVTLLQKSGAEVSFSLDEVHCSSSQSQQTLLITDNMKHLTPSDKELIGQYSLRAIHPEWIVESIINFSIREISAFDLLK